MKDITEIFLEANIGINLLDLALGSDFLDMIPQAIKEKINQLVIVKIKHFCVSKESEKTAQRMGKIFADQMSDKRFTSRIYKEF